ncbi:MAG: DEAD/DEAH box helicase [Actinobacteria bacterium]|nr:DEAD/DEAH box helicase [Actinomycetota bacterium]
MVAEGLLDDDFLSLPREAFPIGRPLYRHQESAIRKLLDGRNVIVATGTGSGKTECFLFPILQHLMKERAAGTLGEPGVRALLLYPMNALANDQMKRLRDLVRVFPDITFARFVGETPEDEGKALDIYRLRFGEEPIPNELISRERIRACPPHILLTNYAMLEYLLLRPADTRIFDGPTGRHWRFVVLDEIHVYNGAQGAEIAMLLRRVRDRVVCSERGILRYVGTSATLGRGEEDYRALADFATALFDEETEYLPHDGRRQDIVSPVKLPLVAADASWELDDDTLDALNEVFRDGASAAHLAGVVRSCGGPHVETNQDTSSYLGELLATESHVVQLQRRLECGSVDFSQLASELFPGSCAERKLSSLIDLGVQAQLAVASAPLVPARYHFLVRALEGAFVCRSPLHPPGEPELRLSRHEHCPSCRDNHVESRMFELSVCRKCGASYIVGTITESGDAVRTLGTASPYAADLLYLLIDDTAELEDEDEDESVVVDDEQAATDVDQRVLCTSCGSLTEGFVPACTCGTNLVKKVIVAHASHRGEPLRRCLACSGRSTNSIVSRFLTGQDAPVAAVATSLYQALPPSSDPAQGVKIGEGRKLLSFSDSRQDAAFFAPYFDRTYSRSVERRLLWHVLSHLMKKEPRFEDLVLPLRCAAEQALVLDPDDGQLQNANRVSSWLMREVLAVDRRQSLDGVGLAELTVAVPLGVQAPPALAALGFTATECIDLARILLDTIRMQAAVHLPDGVDISDQMFSPRNVVTAIRFEQRARNLLAWMPGHGINRRLDYVQKLFKARGISEDPRRVLSEIWHRWLTAPQSPWLKVITPRRDAKEGTVFALNHERITFLSNVDGQRALRCDSCRQTWWRSVSSVCPTYGCQGSLKSVNIDLDHADDHYMRLYTDMRPVGMRVEEHTGQLSAEYAGQLQQQFLDGDLNALSCSTTFELGVDVGEVQAILMRNVPPTPANYVQRAGRAGRRLGAAALVVTFAQRRNHDLHYFENPLALVDGSAVAPILSLENPQIVRRHLHATAFAAFERRHVESGGQWHRTVGDFFIQPTGDGDAAPVDQFIDWLRTRPADLEQALCRITPQEIAGNLSLQDWAWVEALVTEDDRVENYGWLARARNEVRQDMSDIGAEVDQLQTRIRVLTDAGQDAKAKNLVGYLQAVLKVRDTLANRRLLDFLAQRVVLPKYGFPVDVVTLDVWRMGDRQAAQVDLQRDLRLGITDYAPGSRVVADKSLWETVGLRIPAGRALIDYVWAICSDCEAFRTRRGKEPGNCLTCGSADVARKGSFITPMFGFVGQRCTDKPGDTRPLKAGSSEFHFSDYAVPAPEFESVPLGNKTVEVRFSRQGQITVINSGPREQGFFVCRSCGHAEPVPAYPGRRAAAGSAKGGHKRPSGGQSECTTGMSSRHLGHQYLTDVVELRLPVDIGVMSWEQARSTIYALLAATRAIGIIPDEVNGVLSSAGVDASPSLILFDAVPGGAGYAKRIAQRLGDLVDAALHVVANCKCGEDSSCYGCLRSYSNQLYHDQLVRGDALRVLNALAS